MIGYFLKRNAVRLTNEPRFNVLLAVSDRCDNRAIIKALDPSVFVGANLVNQADATLSGGYDMLK
jgi:hypothetical protein